MKHQWAVGIAFAVWTSAVAGFARADIRRIQAEIQRSYAKVAEAYRNKDLKAYQALLAPDVTIKGWDGKTLRLKQILEAAKPGMDETGEIESARIDFRKSVVHGSEVVSDVAEVWKYELIDLRGRYGPKGKSYRVVLRVPGRHTHVKAGSEWVLKRLIETGPTTLKCGGRELVPRGSGAGDEAVRKDLTALFEKVVDAFRNHDISAFEECFTPDARVSIKGTSLSRKNWLALTREDMASNGEIHSSKVAFPRLKVLGNEATADAIETLNYEQLDKKGENGPAGKSYSVTQVAHQRLSCRKTADGWRISRLDMGDNEFSLDGKRVSPVESGRDETTVKREIQQLYDRYADTFKTAVKTRDLSTIRPMVERVCMPGWVMTLHDGKKMNRDQGIKDLENETKHVFAHGHYRVTVEKVRVLDKYRVQTLSYFDIADVREGKNGKVFHRTWKEHDRELWVKTLGGWRCQRTVVEDMKIRQVGKPFVWTEKR